MTRLPQQFQEDRALRDAARAVLLSDIEHARTSLSGKAVAARVAGRIGGGAKDVIDIAKIHADDNRGIIASLIALLALIFARGPIMGILGLSGDPETNSDELLDDADPADKNESDIASEGSSGTQTDLKTEQPPTGDHHE